MKTLSTLLLLILLSACAPKLTVLKPVKPHKTNYRPISTCESAHEQALKVPIKLGRVGKTIYTTIYSVDVTGSQGDVVHLSLSAELTNDTELNTMVAYVIRQGSTFVTEHTGTNITPDIHHLTIPVSTYVILPTNGTTTYEFLVYAASDHPFMTENDYITVEQCYGFMQAYNHNTNELFTSAPKE